MITEKRKKAVKTFYMMSVVRATGGMKNNDSNFETLGSEKVFFQFLVWVIVDFVFNSIRILVMSRVPCALCIVFFIYCFQKKGISDKEINTVHCSSMFVHQSFVIIEPKQQNKTNDEKQRMV